MMKKLRLNLEALQVESFDTASEAAARGTVHGRDRLDDAVIGPQTTEDDSNCPIQSCGCSEPGQRFTECDCETTAPADPGGWA